MGEEPCCRNSVLQLCRKGDVGEHCIPYDKFKLKGQDVRLKCRKPEPAISPRIAEAYCSSNKQVRAICRTTPETSYQQPFYLRDIHVIPFFTAQIPVTAQFRFLKASTIPHDSKAPFACSYQEPRGQTGPLDENVPLPLHRVHLGNVVSSGVMGLAELLA